MVDNGKLVHVGEGIAVISGNVTPSKRLSMLREIMRRQEALTRDTWEQPPLSESEYYGSYEDMRSDPTIATCLAILTEAILSEPPHVEPQEEGRGGLAVADWVQKNLRDVDAESALEEALNALWRGFWPQEITWRHHGGMFALDAISAVHADQLALELNDKMRVTAILNKPIGSDPQRIPIEKVWLHTRKASRIHPAGVSMLDGVYRPWKSKDQLLKFWGLAIQRFGMPFIIAQVPDNMPSQKLTDLLDQFYQLRLDGVALIPQSVAYQVHNPVQWANLAFETALAYQQNEMTAGLLLQLAPSGSATGRTYVTGDGLEITQRALAYRLKRISRQLAESFRRQVIAPLVEANFGPNPLLVPEIVLPTPDATRLIGLAAPLAQIVSAGITNQETAAELLGLPADAIQEPMQKTEPGNDPDSKVGD